MSESAIKVDAIDTAACNLRCVVRHPHTYCAAYPHCTAGYAHRLKAFFERGHHVHPVIREERTRSSLGGHATTRIHDDPDSGATIEEVELHCQTLKFDTLLRKEAAPKKPQAAQPR